jgi:DNA mismatch endonuclease, patch repair protein
MDKITKEKRSWNMSRIKSKNTKPEIMVRAFLYKIGYRYRLHDKKLPGIPDIVLPKYKAVIFVHGCFWHGHEDCKAANLPTTRALFWHDKIFETVLRNRKVYLELQENGLRTAIIWECALKNKETSTYTLNKIDEWIRSDVTNLELPSNIGNDKKVING